MAEITNDKGDMILPQALYVQTNEKAEPTLWDISTSLLKWPIQPLPSTKALNIWKKILKSCLNEQMKLPHP